MNTLLEVNDSFMSSTQMLWSNIISTLPRVALALLVFVVGLFLAAFLGKVITKIAHKAGLDKMVAATGIMSKVEELNIKWMISDLLGWIVKWFIIVAVLLTVSDMLKLSSVSLFLADVLAYIPNVLVAVIILVIGLVVGKFVAEITEKSISSSDIITKSAALVLKTVIKWVIIFFAVMAALTQLNIAPQLVQIFFIGIVLMFTIAGGIAFGLGGKDHARRALDSFFK